MYYLADNQEDRGASPTQVKIRKREFWETDSKQTSMLCMVSVHPSPNKSIHLREFFLQTLGCTSKLLTMSLRGNEQFLNEDGAMASGESALHVILPGTGRVGFAFEPGSTSEVTPAEHLVSEEVRQPVSEWDETGVRRVLRPRFWSQTAQRPTLALVLLETAGAPRVQMSKAPLSALHCRGGSCSWDTWVCQAQV